MSKWITVTGRPADVWHLASDVDLALIDSRLKSSDTVSIPLEAPGTLVVNGARMAAYAFGED
jgi:hypothetical protein